MFLKKTTVVFCIALSIILSSTLNNNKLSNAQAEVKTQNIQLKYANFSRQNKWGVYWWSFSANIIVENIAYDKSVKLVYSLDNWQTVQTADAQYFCSIENNKEIWELSKSFNYTVNALTYENIKFAIVYQVNGVEYWDNNNSKDYCLEPNGTFYLN